MSSEKQKTKLTPEEKIHQKETMVEEMGVFFEQSGFTPMHGRVFAYLLLSDPTYQDFYAIQEFLKASKSAISTALKFLTDRKMIQYITFSGDRKRYFQVDTDGWLLEMKRKLEYAEGMRDFTENVLQYRSELDSPKFNEKLEEIIDFHREMNTCLKDFVTQWEAKRNKK
ncbi:GbsR/MarR family transcriptional regulator [Bernardetia sp. OM2101]|uniref:GbsR/MarR family transcriptional regulator n=1 Tax=Bernardetia sp. OM2101 TaxID=3344876 RepID=UPI0035D05E22